MKRLEVAGFDILVIFPPCHLCFSSYILTSFLSLLYCVIYRPICSFPLPLWKLLRTSSQANQRTSSQGNRRLGFKSCSRSLWSSSQWTLDKDGRNRSWIDERRSWWVLVFPFRLPSLPLEIWPHALSSSPSLIFSRCQTSRSFSSINLNSEPSHNVADLLSSKCSSN